MNFIKEITNRLKKCINGGEKYKNSTVINDLLSDYIEWHHRKNGYPILKKGKSLELLDEFFTEKNIIIYNAQILHGSNNRKPRKELIIALSAAITGILLSILIASLFF